VDNDFDLRVLGEYLNKAFNAECESKISLMSYLSPPSNTINSVMTQVNNVKDVDDPDMFGLPADVEKNILRFKTLELVSQLKLMQSSLDVNVNKEEIANTL